MPPGMRLVKVVGALLVLCGAVGLVWFASFWLSPQSWGYIHGPNPPHPIHVIFMLVVNVYYLLIGLGIWLQAKWGYLLLKSLLYLCLLGFPILTVLSWLMLRYMRRHGIRRHFGFTDV